MADNRELVHGHCGLVFSVDALVSYQAGSRDHICGHAIAYEEDDVLGLAFLSQIADEPGRLRLGSIVVGEGCHVLARLVKRNAAIGLGCDID